MAVMVWQSSQTTTRKAKGGPPICCTHRARVGNRHFTSSTKIRLIVLFVL